MKTYEDFIEEYCNAPALFDRIEAIVASVEGMK